MRIYFAYGSNLDRTGMAQRCPRAVPLQCGRLADHQFFIMSNGYASVRAQQGLLVHGLLWAITDADLAALDAYEEVAGGLYCRATVPIITQDGTTLPALIYLGTSDTSGRPWPGYMEGIVAAAAALNLPASYLDELRRWLPDGTI